MKSQKSQVSLKTENSGLHYILVIAVFIITTFAATANAGELSRRWMVELNLAGWSSGHDASVTSSFTGVKTTYGGTGAGGGISVGRWLQEDLAVLIAIEGRMVDNTVSAGISGVTTDFNYLSRIHLQVRYNPFKSTLTSSVRPYVAAAAGPVIGYQGSIKVGLTVATEETTEAAFGGEIAVGTNFILSRLFVVGLELGALGMTDFGQPIGGRVNYSGVKFGLGFGILIG